jgi:hypothetical protein
VAARTDVISVRSRVTGRQVLIDGLGFRKT